MVGGNEQSQNNGTNSINTNPNPLNNSVPNGNSNFDSVSNGLDVNTPGVNTTNNDITSTTVNNNYVSNANDNVSSSVDSNVVDNNMTNNSTNIESNVGSNTNEPVANPGTVMNNGGLNEALTPNDNLAQQIQKKIPNKDTCIIVYCSSGSRSKQAQQLLIQMGYEEVYNLKNGYQSIYEIF